MYKFSILLGTEDLLGSYFILFLFSRVHLVAPAAFLGRNAYFLTGHYDYTASSWSSSAFSSLYWWNWKMDSFWFSSSQILFGLFFQPLQLLVLSPCQTLAFYEGVQCPEEKVTHPCAPHHCLFQCISSLGFPRGSVELFPHLGHSDFLEVFLT